MAKKSPKKKPAPVEAPKVAKAKRRPRQSKQPKAPAPPKPVKVSAVYTPLGHARCPRCLSVPSVAGRIKHDDDRGWGLMRSDDVRVEKRTMAVYASRYPCANPECITEITTLRTMDFLNHVEVNPPMDKATTKRWEKGSTGKDGIWRDIPAPEPVVATTVLPQQKRASIRGVR